MQRSLTGILPSKPINSVNARQNFPPGYVLGPSESMARLHRELDLLSRGDFSVLLLGETGVGKDRLARLIHFWSKRRHQPFIAVNCAAIPTELLEAEMFGIGKGVASGVLERKGYFQLATGGTLFLDEIGEMHPSLQVKLLRALEDRVIRQVGGATIEADVRIIAATNADLRTKMEARTFRSDLYYRVAGFEVRVPALRDRKEDIKSLVAHFVSHFMDETGRSLGSVTKEALDLLSKYCWPGNIRELEHEIRRLVYLCPEDHPMDSSLLSSHILQPTVINHTTEQTLSNSLLIERHFAAIERMLIPQALAWADGNYSRAAKLLGVSRNGLAIKMRRLGIPESQRKFL